MKRHTQSMTCGAQSQPQPAADKQSGRAFNFYVLPVLLNLDIFKSGSD